MQTTRLPLLVAASLAASGLGASGLAASPAFDGPRLVADLVPGVGTVPLSQPPQPVFAAGGRMLFTAETPGGRDLWSSDGTPGGSERLFAAAGGQGYLAWEQAGQVELLVEPPGGGDGPTLFRTDGTAAGTRLIAAWSRAAFVAWLGRGTQRSWFAPCYAEDARYRCELWLVEGAATTATLLAGDLGFHSGGFQEQPIAGNRLFFFTGENGTDVRLWRSDGTPGSTVPVVALPQTVATSWLGRRGRSVFFAVIPPQGGSEVWRSDGTAGGTRLLRRLPLAQAYALGVPPDAGSGPLFFATYQPGSGSDLWAVTAAGRVKRLGSFAVAEQPAYVGRGPGGSGRYLFAAARRPPSPGEGTRLRLWVTDGTPGGTAELRAHGGARPFVERTLGVAGGRLYFAGNDGSPDTEPWTSDGTAAGTRRLADICPGLCGVELGGIVTLGDAALFVAGRGGTHTLWRADAAGHAAEVATLGGTATLGDGAAGVPLGLVAGGRVFFGIATAGGFELWASDGTTAGTRAVEPGFTAALGSAPVALAASADALLFAAVDPLDPSRRRIHLQRDGEAPPAGVPLPDFLQPSAGALDEARDLALFVATDGDYRSQLWVTDGSPPGTLQLTAFGTRLLADDKYHDECYDSVEPPVRSGDRWLFAAYVCGEGVQLWSTDGSLAGTRRESAVPDDAAGVELVGDRVFFLAPLTAPDGSFEAQLFHTTLGATTPVQLTSRAGGIGLFVRHWEAPSLGRLYFVPMVSEGELWVSDGTVAGTRPVVVNGDPPARLGGVLQVAAGAGFALAWQDTEPGARHTLFAIAADTGVATAVGTVGVIDPYRELEWGSFGGRVLFAANGVQHGDEPWVSDGTAAGTHPIADLAGGPSSSLPHAFASSDAGVFFSARTFETGEELWVSDGTAAGTRLVADLAPGSESSSPAGAVAGAGRLLFAADDGASGREPWVLEWNAPAAGAAQGGGR